MKLDPSNPPPYFALLIKDGEVIQTGNSDGRKQIYWNGLILGVAIVNISL